MKENIIVTDFNTPESWGFIKGINENCCLQYKIVTKIANGTQKSFIRKIIRYFKYFHFSLSLFLKKKKYYSIIAWQQFYGIFLAYFLKLFHCKNGPKVTILTFIYKEKKGIKGKIYHHFISTALKYKNLQKICVLS